MADCMRLHVLWRRYEYHITLHTGQGARGEHTLDECANRRYDRALADLEEMLRRGRIPSQLIVAQDLR